MKKNSIIALIFLITMSMESQNEVKVYKMDNFEFRYPSSWTVVTNTGSEATVLIKSPLKNSEDKFPENINLIVQDLKGTGIDFDQYVKLNQQQIKTVPNGMMLENYSKKGKESKKHVFVFKGSSGNFNFKSKQLHIIKGETAYILTFIAKEDEYDDYKKPRELIMGSFKIID